MFKFGNSQGSLVKWLLLGLGQGTYKIGLEHFLVSESMEAWPSTLPRDVVVSKERRNPWKQLPGPKLEQYEQHNKVVLEYNPKYKINKSTLTYITKWYNK